jgi:GNAT superfamily N-acetyltransferase
MTQSAVPLRVLTVDEWPLFRELRLEALREAPHAFGSILDDWQGDGDTEQRWRQRLADVPFNVIAFFADIPSGIVSAINPDGSGVVELISMYVTPFARGKGVGDALVTAVIHWAKERHINKLSLDVMDDNYRAKALYRRHGFADNGWVEAQEGRPERRMLRIEYAE